MDSVNNVSLDSFIAEKGLKKLNGDIGFIHEKGNKVFLGLIDGSGHGIEAYKIAKDAKQYLEENMETELAPLMIGLHQHILGSRGCVAIIAYLDIASLQLTYVGVGNICLRKFGRTHERALLTEGIIGYTISTPKEKLMQLENGDVLVLHSDGIKSHFSFNDYPEILKDDAKSIAINIIQKFGKKNDDVACIIMRCTSNRL